MVSLSLLSAKLKKNTSFSLQALAVSTHSFNIQLRFKLWMLLWPLNSRYRRSLHSHCMIPLPALRGTMQKRFREHPTRRVLVRAVFPPQSGWTRTQVLCYTGQWYSRRTWSWKFWEISRRLHCSYNQSTLYTACMCHHLEEKGVSRYVMESQRVMEMVC